MLNWPSYGIERASKDFQKLTVGNSINPELTKEFQELRDVLIEKRDEVFDKFMLDQGIKEKYIFDLNYGLAIFEVLKNDFNLDNRVASNDDVWRYLSVKVIPDIVHSRWNFNEDHFYKMSRRIWLKQIWWYINLSWCGNKDNTYSVLKSNTTDTISNLVERPGLGYNIELFREVMKQYPLQNDDSRLILRKVLVLNTARVKMISPELIEGGIERYVQNFYEAVDK